MFTTESKTFGERLKELRKSKSLTLQAMADILGVSNGFLSEVERGKKMPGGDFFISLKREFGVSIDFMLLDSGEVPTYEGQREVDPYISSVAEMMRSMDNDTKKDIQLSVEKEKLLRDLLTERKNKKAG